MRYLNAKYFNIASEYEQLTLRTLPVSQGQEFKQKLQKILRVNSMHAAKNHIYGRVKTYDADIPEVEKLFASYGLPIKIQTY